MEPRKAPVVFRGVKVAAGWPEKLGEAQTLVSYTVSGRSFPRIRFGSEGEDGWGSKPCLDCGAIAGEFHVPACEYEKCPACNHFFAEGCVCEIEELRGDPREEPPRYRSDRIETMGKRVLLAGLGLSLVIFLFWLWHVGAFR